MNCCGYPMLARKNYNGDPIWWCTKCGRKRPRKENSAEPHSISTEAIKGGNRDMRKHVILEVSEKEVQEQYELMAVDLKVIEQSELCEDSDKEVE